MEERWRGANGPELGKKTWTSAVRFYMLDHVRHKLTSDKISIEFQVLARTASYRVF